MFPHEVLQQGAAPHSYLFASLIQDLHKLGWKPACGGKQLCGEQQELAQPFSPRSKNKGLSNHPEPSSKPDMTRRPSGEKSPAPSEARSLRLGRAKAFLGSLQQAKALTSQAVQLTHPAVLILLGNDLQKRTGQGSGPSQSRCPHTGWAEIKLIQHPLALYREGEEAHTHRDDVIFAEA